VHDLIGELNDVLRAAYESHHQYGLSIVELFEAHVRFFLARLDGLAMAWGRRPFQTRSTRHRKQPGRAVWILT
jgi:hypothetical protein